jgi:hypothetical protein
MSSGRPLASLPLSIPIETVALPELIEGKSIEEEVPVFKYKYPMWRVVRFWRREPPTRWWTFTTNLQRWAWDRKRRAAQKKAATDADSTDPSWPLLSATTYLWLIGNNIDTRVRASKYCTDLIQNAMIGLWISGLDHRLESDFGMNWEYA